MIDLQYFSHLIENFMELMKLIKIYHFSKIISGLITTNPAWIDWKYYVQLPNQSNMEF